MRKQTWMGLIGVIFLAHGGEKPAYGATDGVRMAPTGAATCLGDGLLCDQLSSCCSGYCDPYNRRCGWEPPTAAEPDAR
jgi:hypothetical protein